MSGAAGRPGAGVSGRPGVARSCPACGAADARPWGVPGDAGAQARTVRCPRCRLVFVDPVPAAAVAAETYGAGYYEPWQERRQASARARLWRRRLARIERRRPARGSLLDVGCGDGAFLSAARAAGWDAEGIEFSPEGARRAAARCGRPVAVGDLARSAVLAGPFEVVTLWHVLEHLALPAPMLDAVRSRLRPGGLLVVAVPNLDNLPMRAAYRVVRGRPLPLYEDGAREPHLSHFDPRTLAALLVRHGFTDVEIGPDPCALALAPRLLDAAARLLSILCRRLVTDAMTAFARRPL